MFSCTACLRRAILALDLVSTSVRPSPLFLSPTSSTSPRPRPRARVHTARPQTQTRLSTTVRSIRKGHHQRLLREVARNPEKNLPLRRLERGRERFTQVQKRDVRARRNNRDLLDQNFAKHEPGTVTTEQRQSKDEWRVAHYLRDPLKLAGAVLQRLRDGDGAGALELVRASEKVPVATGTGEAQRVPLENVVSWNHLMDWHMHEGDTKAALKIYNEMKKRGHRPDAHTYTIMLRGFADSQNIKKPGAVSEAVAVYNSIFATNSRVVANTIHTNAIINVCARGGDMDALWAVTGRLPDKGPGAPDKWTYTTVLHALRADAVGRAAGVKGIKNGEGYEEEDGARLAVDVGKVFDGAVKDGRRLWEDVVCKWRSGDLMVDEPLVCAMGRLLLISLVKRDWADVGALVEQTMGIENQMGALELTRFEAIEAPEEKASDYDSGKTRAPADRLLAKAGKLPASTNEFTPVAVKSSPSVRPHPNHRHSPTGPTPSIYAAPGNNTLSLLVEASTLVKSPAAGRAYWDLLTSPSGPYTLSPDAQNLGAYLRLLRLSRASQAARDLLRADYDDLVEREFFQKRGTFVIAMSACVRDKNNPHSFDYASSVLDMMLERLEPIRVEPRVLVMYIDLAVATTPGLERSATFVPDLRTNNLMRMLGRMRADAINIKKLVTMRIESEEYGKLPARVKRRRGFTMPSDVPSGLEDLAAVLRSLVGAYDRVLAVAAGELGPVRFSGGVSERRWDEFVEDAGDQKRKLAKFLTKMIVGVPRAKWEGLDSERKAAVGGREIDAQEQGQGQGEEAETETETENEPEFTDDDAARAVPAKRKTFRALSEGAGEYEKLPRSKTRYAARQQEERKRQEAERAVFPRSMLKPMPRREVRVRARPVRRERKVDEEEDMPVSWGGGAVGDVRGKEAWKGDFVQL